MLTTNNAANANTVLVPQSPHPSGKTNLECSAQIQWKEGAVVYSDPTNSYVLNLLQFRDTARKQTLLPRVGACQQSPHYPTIDIFTEAN